MMQCMLVVDKTTNSYNCACCSSVINTVVISEVVVLSG